MCESWKAMPMFKGVAETLVCLVGYRMLFHAFNAQFRRRFLTH